MSFTYQRTHKSVCIDTRPNLRSAHALFGSDSEDEEEHDGRQERGQTPLALTYEPSSEPETEPEPRGDPAWQFKARMWIETKAKQIFLKELFTIFIHKIMDGGFIFFSNLSEFGIK